MHDRLLICKRGGNLQMSCWWTWADGCDPHVQCCAFVNFAYSVQNRSHWCHCLGVWWCCSIMTDGFWAASSLGLRCACVSCGEACVCVCIDDMTAWWMEASFVFLLLSAVCTSGNGCLRPCCSHTWTHTCVCPRKDVRCEILPVYHTFNVTAQQKGPKQTLTECQMRVEVDFGQRFSLFWRKTLQVKPVFFHTLFSFEILGYFAYITFFSG